MAELKTKATKASVKRFLDGLADEQQRKDSYAICKMMERSAGSKAAMWGPSIVGFGHCMYRYPNGKEMPWFPIGFSPRRTALTLYVMHGLRTRPDLLKKLGKHKTGKGCLYIRRLADVDQKVLEELIGASIADAQEQAR